MEDRFPLVEGSIQSGYFVFLRKNKALKGETHALQLLGLGGYEVRARSAEDPISASVLVTECGAWLHVADDLLYTLWHRFGFQSVTACAAVTDVFAMVLGDCDQSYELRLWENGALVRHLRVDCPNLTDRVTVVDEGRPLLGEDKHGDTDARAILLAVTRGLRIDMTHDVRRIRRHGPSK